MRFMSPFLKMHRHLISTYDNNSHERSVFLKKSPIHDGIISLQILKMTLIRTGSIFKMEKMDTDGEKLSHPSPDHDTMDFLAFMRPFLMEFPSKNTSLPSLKWEQNGNNTSKKRGTHGVGHPYARHRSKSDIVLFRHLKKNIFSPKSYLIASATTSATPLSRGFGRISFGVGFLIYPAIASAARIFISSVISRL